MKLSHLFTYDCTPGHLYKIPHAPFSVLWDICYACNQRCQFCYNSQSNFHRQIPSQEVSLRILNVLHDWGVNEVIYLGGEPLLSPSLPHLISRAHSLGISQRLITNGQLIDRFVAKLLHDNDVETGISLHGTNPSNHDCLTNVQGSFQKAINAIDCLCKESTSWFVQFTPTKSTNTLLESAIELKKRFPKIRSIDINRLLPQGIGQQNAASIFLGEDEWWECITQIPKVKDMGINVSIESIPHCWIYKNAYLNNLSIKATESIIKSIRPCYMGINQIALSDQGRFKLCPGGSELSPSILDIPPITLWQTSPILNARRQFEFLPTTCLSFKDKKMCEHFYMCGGGCKMSTCGNDLIKKPQPDPLINPTSMSFDVNQEI